ncbi:MAG: hypothetical protein WCE75_12665, partial [Terracidiphilus sp.]
MAHLKSKTAQNPNPCAGGGVLYSMHGAGSSATPRGALQPDGNHNVTVKSIHRSAPSGAAGP